MANGRFDLENAVAYAQALARTGLRWYEEAGDPLDYQLQAKLANYYPGPMATGEKPILPAGRTKSHSYAQMRSDRDILQFDCAVELRTSRIPSNPGHVEGIWMVAGPLHSARRHQMSLNIAAGLGLGGNESYSGIFQPFGGFADGIAVKDSYVKLPEIPGVGFEEKSEMFRVMKGAGGKLGDLHSNRTERFPSS